MPATLNALEPDPGDNPSRDPSTDPPVQAVQWTKENQISTGTGPPSAEWQTETPTVQEKIGVTPHTLHERRPLTKTKTHERFQETEQREAKDWQDILTP